MENLDLYELTLDDINFDGMTAISLVDFPAIEKNFMLFKKDKKQNFSEAKLDQKNIITGPALIPDKKIYRVDWTKGEYEVFFKENTIRKISEEFIKKNKDNVTIDHLYNANNIYLIESWIIEDPKNDKSNALGFSELPKGTWMISYKVENEPILEMIKSNELVGFSIEAFVTQKLIEKMNKTEQAVLSKIEKIVFDETLSEQIQLKKLEEIINILK